MNDSWHEKLKNKNREEIIEAGKQLFLKHNFINVNIKDVCELAAISRVTFYKHFKTIDELAFEVQMDILKHMVQYIRNNSNSEANGKEIIQNMLYAWIGFAKEYRDEMKYIILFDLYYGAYDTNEELKLRYNNFIVEDSSSNFFNDAINKGIEDKSLRSDLDTVKTAYYIFQTTMGLLQRMSYTSLPDNAESVTFDEIANMVVDMIISYIENKG